MAGFALGEARFRRALVDVELAACTVKAAAAAAEVVVVLVDTGGAWQRERAHSGHAAGTGAGSRLEASHMPACQAGQKGGMCRYLERSSCASGVGRGGSKCDCAAAICADGYGAYPGEHGHTTGWETGPRATDAGNKDAHCSALSGFSDTVELAWGSAHH